MDTQLDLRPSTSGLARPFLSSLAGAGRQYDGCIGDGGTSTEDGRHGSGCRRWWTSGSLTLKFLVGITFAAKHRYLPGARQSLRPDRAKTIANRPGEPLRTFHEGTE